MPSRQHVGPGATGPVLPEPSLAERARTLASLGRIGSLSTPSRQFTGFPFGSMMPYAADDRGCPVFFISSMAMHTQDGVSTSFTIRLEQALKSYAKPAFVRPIRIFRDEKHLSPGIDLPKLILEALDASEFLILLASPDAARSPWVKVEIDHWCGQLGRTGNLIILLVDGEIATNDETKGIDWTRTTALPPALATYVTHVPLYLDLRAQAHIEDVTIKHPQFVTAINAIAARFRGIDPNEMLGEEIHQHRRTLRIRNIGISALAGLALALALAAYIALIQREEARQQARIAVSRQYAAEAGNLVQGQLDDAILRAAQAVTTEDTFEARNLLFQTLDYNKDIEAFLYRMGDNERSVPVVAFHPSRNELALGVAGELHMFELSNPSAPRRRVISLAPDQPTSQQAAAGRSATDLTPARQIRSLAYSHDGSTLAIGEQNGQVSIISTADGTRARAPIALSGQMVNRLCFTPRDDQLLAISNGHVFTVALPSGAVLRAEQLNSSFVGPNPASDNSIGADTRPRRLPDIATVTPDGRLIANGFARGITVWDLAGPLTPRLTFNVGHLFTVGIRELAISPGGDMLAVDLEAGSDGIPLNFVYLFRLDQIADGEARGVTPQKVLTTVKYIGDSSRLAFNPAGDRLLIGNAGPSFYLIDVKASAQDERGEFDLTQTAVLSRSPYVRRIDIKGLTGSVHDPRFSPDGKNIALGIGTRVILSNPASPQKLSQTLVTHAHRPSDIAFSRDDTEVRLSTLDGFVFAWNTKEPTATPPAPVTLSGSGFFTRGGERIAVMADDRLSVTDVRTRQVAYKTSLAPWHLLAMSPDERFMATLREGVVRMLAVPDRELWRAQVYDQQQIHNPPVRGPGVSFSSDSSRTAVHVYGSN